MPKIMIFFKISDYIRDFIGLIFPDLCFACSENLMGDEKFICLKCQMDLPETHFSVMEGNPVEQAFWGRVNVAAATALLRFEKGGKVQHLLHALKYKGQTDLGVFMGELMGKSIAHNTRFSSLDAVIPVPLHPRKFRKRTYNQSSCLAEGIASILHVPVREEVLVRKIYNPTQTRKGRYQRWENVDGIFEVKSPETIEGKHFLLVDDVLTTGSTLEASALPLLKVNHTKVSIMTFAYA